MQFLLCKIRAYMIYVVTSAAIFWLGPRYEAQYMFYTQNYCWFKTRSVKKQLKELIFIFYLDSYSEFIFRTLWHFLSYSFTFSPFNTYMMKDKLGLVCIGITNKLINWDLNYVSCEGYTSLSINKNLSLRQITTWKEELKMPGMPLPLSPLQCPAGAPRSSLLLWSHCWPPRGASFFIGSLL